ncbi:MAG: thymidine kinase [Lachnospirales bacterium]
MAKLYFKFGAMGGGKTLDCIRTFYNYKERNLIAKVYKSALDTRSLEICSRTGDSMPCEVITETHSIEELFKDITSKNTDVIIIDEAHWLTTKQVNDLKDFAIDFDIPIICYGLLTDFKSYLFEGSKRLIELADRKEEIKSICWCGKLATQNARVTEIEVDGVKKRKVIKEGEQYLVGGNELYIPLCYLHFRNSDLGNL